MESERAQKIEEMFHAALSLDASERPGFLASIADEAVRREVESLLAADNRARAADFMASLAVETLIQGDQSTGATRGLLAPGMMLGERYLIERQLGIGGIGVVYLARDQKLHSAPVVVKVLMDRSMDAEHKTWFEEKFKQEIKALARIDHPGVVRALDIGELADGRTYLVMQFAPGVMLRSVIGQHGMELARAGALIRQIGQALTAAHEQGVIHRDLKPENIIVQKVGDEEYARLIDFGIATVLDDPAQTTIKTTKVIGTPDYMAPEQLQGKPRAASDIYALGVVAYEMVTGRRPFNLESNDLLQALQQLQELQRAGVRVKPCDLRPSLPAAAQAVILNALAFKPKDRYARAKDFGEALAKTLTGERANTRAPRPLLLLAALLAVIVVAIVSLWPIIPGWKPPDDKSIEKPTSEITLSYSLEVQKDPNRYPGDKPFILPDAILFSDGDRVRFLISSPQSGYLYIINEGPNRTNDLPQFNVLFPDTITNGGSAEIRANQRVQIPQPSSKPHLDWFILDKQTGAEKIWLVWSKGSVPELEAVKGWANPKDRGAIGNPNQIKSVEQYLAARSATEPEIEKNEATRQTTLKSKGEALVKLVKLEHH
jgi:serine/threonine protein kinase